MNLKEYIERAKKVLNEDAGSEGMSYKLTYKGTIPALDGMEVEHLPVENGNKVCIIKFTYPKDYGFANNCLAALGIEIVTLELLF